MRSSVSRGSLAFTDVSDYVGGWKTLKKQQHAQYDKNLKDLNVAKLSEMKKVKPISGSEIKEMIKVLAFSTGEFFKVFIREQT